MPDSELPTTQDHDLSEDCWCRPDVVAVADPTVPPAWDYWRPHEGLHFLDPNELHVGIINRSQVHIAAVVPPWRTPLGTFQNEGFAIAIRDALAAGPWTKPNGLADWLADKGLVLAFPVVVEPRSLVGHPDAVSPEISARDDAGRSEEQCVRCGWTMGRPPLNCQNDNTPHVFPSQLPQHWEGQRAWVSSSHADPDALAVADPTRAGEAGNP